MVNQCFSVGFVAHNSRRVKWGMNWPRSHRQHCLTDIHNRLCASGLSPLQKTLLFHSVSLPLFIENKLNFLSPAQHVLWVLLNPVCRRFSQICLLRPQEWDTKPLRQSKDNRKGALTTSRSGQLALPVSVRKHILFWNMRQLQTPGKGIYTGLSICNFCAYCLNTCLYACKRTCLDDQ